MIFYSDLLSVVLCSFRVSFFFFFQAEDGIRDLTVTGVQTCALPILQEVEGRLRTIRQRLPAIVDERAARLQERVKRLLEGAGAGRDSVDQSRLAQEVALLADRSDVSEELTRLDSHLDQFRAFLRKTEPVGRSLDFLLQEMNREINTIGSKVGDTVVTQEVVAVKAELEKIREQVQNVE